MDRVENLTRTSESISWEWEVEGWRNAIAVAAPLLFRIVDGVVVDKDDDEDDEEE